MTTPNIGRPKMVAPFRSEPRRYETCQHAFYRNSQIELCGAPTRNGKPTCDECRKLEGQGAGSQRQDSFVTMPRRASLTA